MVSMMVTYLVSGPAQPGHMFLIRRVWVEERNRQETEDRVGRLPVTTKRHKFIAHSPSMPQSKGKGTRLP